MSQPTADPHLHQPLIHRGDNLYIHLTRTDERQEGVFITNAGHFKSGTEWHAWADVDGHRVLVNLDTYDFEPD